MGFEMTTRAAQSLSGKIWEGSYEDAAAGHVKNIMAEMESLRVRLASEQGGTEVGLVCVSWNDIPGGFRYLVALPPALCERGEADGMEVWSFPEMRFVTAWHDAADGDVFKHYRRMFDWIEEGGLKRSIETMHHREEYPAGLDLDAAPRLRLMTPVREPAG